jgi:hypothetical protein
MRPAQDVTTPETNILADSCKSTEADVSKLYIRKGCSAGSGNVLHSDSEVEAAETDLEVAAQNQPEGAAWMGSGQKERLDRSAA